MEQNYVWANRNQRPDQYRPPVVKGNEPMHRRTGTATRVGTPTCGMMQRPMMRSTQTANNARQEPAPDQDNCSYGTLPANAPLANPYVPYQKENAPRYPTQKGLVRGTMYPGLDLPLCGKVNSEKPCTPKTELMALQFAIVELALYLDMHPNDCDALAVYRDYVAKAEEAKCAYEQKFGPLTLKAAGKNNTWDWICDPWPWDYCQEG